MSENYPKQYTDNYSGIQSRLSYIEGRLAIAESQQGMRLGSILLANTLQRLTRTSHVLTFRAVIVDVFNDQTTKLYRQFCFISYPANH
jgi:predicted GNAT family N-acyltransferase